MAMVPFRYREFHDVPRTFCVELSGRLLLFDCPFDDTLDEYPAEYRVYELHPEAGQFLGDRDWRPLLSRARLIGTVPVAQVRFDPTRRRMVLEETLRSGSDPCGI